MRHRSLESEPPEEEVSSPESHNQGIPSRNPSFLKMAPTEHPIPDQPWPRRDDHHVPESTGLPISPPRRKTGRPRSHDFDFQKSRYTNPRKKYDVVAPPMHHPLLIGHI